MSKLTYIIVFATSYLTGTYLLLIVIPIMWYCYPRAKKERDVVVKKRNKIFSRPSFF